jgi:hypothetical protein
MPNLSLKTQNTERIYWTKHVKKKMRQYQLSESRLKRVLRQPERKEIGIAPGTTAVMQTCGSKKHPKEIWLMYQTTTQSSKQKTQKLKIISAWRYPGISPQGQPLTIPEDIVQELLKEGLI